MGMPLAVNVSEPPTSRGTPAAAPELRGGFLTDDVPLELTQPGAQMPADDEVDAVALGVKSAAIAGVLTGGVGLLGGALALKKKRLCVITWSNGHETLVEVRSRQTHQNLVTAASEVGDLLDRGPGYIEPCSSVSS